MSEVVARAKTGAVLTGDVAEVFLDVTLSESRSIEVEWSEYPLEDRSVITDHGVMRPDLVDLTGVLTRLSSDPRRLEDRIDAIDALIKAKGLVDIAVGTRVYQDYVLTSFSYSRSVSDGQSYQISLSARQIATVAAVVVATQLSEGVEASATPEQNAGTQTASTDDDETSGAVASIQASITAVGRNFLLQQGDD